MFFSKAFALDNWGISYLTSLLPPTHTHHPPAILLSSAIRLCIHRYVMKLFV